MKTLYILLAAIVVPCGGLVAAYHYLRTPEKKRRDFDKLVVPINAVSDSVKKNWTRVTRITRNHIHTERPPNGPSGVPDQA